MKDFMFQTDYDADTAFRTYMLPEPATLGLLAVGAAAVIRRRRK